jgi:hypothetical protein
MKNPNVQDRLNKSAKRFVQVKKLKPEVFLDEVVDSMSTIGGITGFNVRSNGTMTLCNHTANYNLPIRYEEHSQRLSSMGKKAYGFLEGLYHHLSQEGVSPRNMQFHLGKNYSSKHHCPF